MEKIKNKDVKDIPSIFTIFGMTGDLAAKKIIRSNETFGFTGYHSRAR